MKKFLEKHFILIVFIFLILTFLKSCSEIRTLQEVQNSVEIIKDTTFTKTEFNDIFVIITLYNQKIAEREGLRAELRFYQSTDRKLMDVQRQAAVEELIKNLDKQINDIERKLYEKMAK